MRSVADRIPQSFDLVPVRNEWSHLISPLAQALTIPVEVAPLQLYVDPAGHRGEMPVTYFGNALPALPGDWRGKYNNLINIFGRPIVLLGDPGVGKSAWVSRFIAHLVTQKNVSAIRFDHHQHDGWPVAFGLSPSERVRGHLVTDLLSGLKAALKKYRLTGNPLFAIDEDEILADPHSKITRRCWDTIANSVKILDEKCGHTVFVFLDNLDLYPAEIQHTGIAFASHIAQWKGIRSVISLRPATYDALDSSDIELRNPVVYPINAIPLGAMIKNRLAYVWTPKEGNADVRQVLATLENITLDLTWARDQTSLPATLRNVHERVVNQLTENTSFEQAIQDLHNFNMREMLEVVKQLLESSYFSELIRNAIAGTAEKANAENLITAYLRGPYKRHRGRTIEYRVRSLNILDVPGVPDQYVLVALRALQWLSKWPTSTAGARTVISWKETLAQYGYPTEYIERAIIYLAQLEMVFDVKRQLNWTRLSDPSLLDSDCFVISPEGRFVLEKMMSRYAFRFADAMADVIRRPRPDGEEWTSFKDREPMIRNVLGIVDLLLNAVEQENAMVESAVPAKDIIDIRRRFAGDFASREVAGANFILPFAKECCGRARTLQYAQENMTAFRDDRKLKIYLDSTISVIIKKAERLSVGDRS